jgi:hypothetical protein
MARRGRRTERVALVVALVVAVASGSLLLLTRDDGEQRTDAARQATTTSRPPTTTSTLAPGCDIFPDKEQQNETARHIHRLLSHLFYNPTDDEAVLETIQALDAYTENELPVLAAGLGELATDLPERRDGALLLRRFVVEVVRALEAADSAEGVIGALFAAFTREDAGAAMVAIGDFVVYDLQFCPQPVE